MSTSKTTTGTEGESNPPELTNETKELVENSVSLIGEVCILRKDNATFLKGSLDTSPILGEWAGYKDVVTGEEKSRYVADEAIKLLTALPITLRRYLEKGRSEEATSLLLGAAKAPENYAEDGIQNLYKTKAIVFDHLEREMRLGNIETGAVLRSIADDLSDRISTLSRKKREIQERMGKHSEQN